jgi:hypothetical protein
MNVKNSEVFKTKRCLIWLLEVVDRRFELNVQFKLTSCSTLLTYVNLYQNVSKLVVMTTIMSFYRAVHD